MGCINIAVKKLPSTVAKHSTHAKTNYFHNSNSKLKLYKIQNVTVKENPKLENEEDFAEDIAKAIEEAYSFSCYFGIRFILFFDFFASNVFGKGYFYGPVQISSSVFFIIFRALPNCTRA